MAKANQLRLNFYIGFGSPYLSVAMLPDSGYLKPTGSWEEVYRVCQIARAYCLYLKRVKFCFRCLALLVSEFHRWFVAMSVRDPQGQTDGNCIRAECLTVFWELQCA